MTFMEEIMSPEISNLELFVSLSPLRRLLHFKWWFYVLALLGLLAAGFSIFNSFSGLGDPMRKKSEQPSSSLSMNLIVSPLSAQIGDSSQFGTGGKIDEKTKPYVMAGILSIIGVVTLTSLLVSLTATNKNRVAAASDTLKTCLGFFIGVATGYF